MFFCVCRLIKKEEGPLKEPDEVEGTASRFVTHFSTSDPEKEALRIDTERFQVSENYFSLLPIQSSTKDAEKHIAVQIK